MTRLPAASFSFARVSLPPADRWQLLAGLVFVVTCVAPGVLLVTAALSAFEPAGSFASIVRAGARGLGGSTLTALGAAALGVVCGVPLGEALTCLRGRVGTVLRFGTLLPLAVPPLAFALGVRRLLEFAGMAAPGSGAAMLLPLVLAEGCVTIALVAAAWSVTRQPRWSAARAARDEAALLLGVGASTRWRMGDPRGASAGLRLGLALALLHALTSAAAPAVFPAAAQLSLPMLLLEGTTLRGLAGLAAALPLLITLPLLIIALRAARNRAREENSDAISLARPEDRAMALVAGTILLVWVILPLGAVLLTGMSPESIAALVLDTRTGTLPALLAGSALLALAACLGALLTLAFVAPSVSPGLRGGVGPWLALAYPPLSLAVVAGIGSEVGARASEFALHALLGYGAALPLLLAFSNGASRSDVDSARVLGASTLQAVWWRDRERASGTLIAALTLACLASLGDLTAFALDPIATARALAPAAVVLLHGGPDDASRGAYVLASVLAAAGLSAVFALLRTGVGELAIWSRR